jgi:hypothetical protein
MFGAGPGDGWDGYTNDWEGKNAPPGGGAFETRRADGIMQRYALLDSQLCPPVKDVNPISQVIS